MENELEVKLTLSEALDEIYSPDAKKFEITTVEFVQNYIYA